MEPMARYPRLQRRGSRYFLRAKVPRDLVVVIGKREIIRALETSDFKTAVRRLGIASVEVDAQFAEARRNGQVSGVSRASLRSWALDYFRSLEEAAGGRYPLLDHEVRRQTLENLRDEEIVLSGGEGDTHLASIQSATDGLLSSRGVVLQRGSDEWWSLCQLVNRALLEHTRRNREHCGGDFRAKTFDPFFAQVQVRVPSLSPAKASVGEGSPLQISDLMKAWGSETRPARKTLYSWGRILDKLCNHIGHSDANRLAASARRASRSVDERRALAENLVTFKAPNIM
jgi:hypothetical protein